MEYCFVHKDYRHHTPSQSRRSTLQQPPPSVNTNPSSPPSPGDDRTSKTIRSPHSVPPPPGYDDADRRKHAPWREVTLTPGQCEGKTSFQVQSSNAKDSLYHLRDARWRQKLHKLLAESEERFTYAILLPSSLDPNLQRDASSETEKLAKPLTHTGISDLQEYPEPSIYRLPQGISTTYYHPEGASYRVTEAELSRLFGPKYKIVMMRQLLLKPPHGLASERPIPGLGVVGTFGNGLDLTHLPEEIKQLEFGDLLSEFGNIDSLSEIASLTSRSLEKSRTYPVLPTSSRLRLTSLDRTPVVMSHDGVVPETDCNGEPISPPPLDPTPKGSPEKQQCANTLTNERIQRKKLELRARADALRPSLQIPQPPLSAISERSECSTKDGSASAVRSFDDVPDEPNGSDIQRKPAASPLPSVPETLAESPHTPSPPIPFDQARSLGFTAMMEAGFAAEPAFPFNPSISETRHEPGHVFSSPFPIRQTRPSDSSTLSEAVPRSEPAISPLRQAPETLAASIRTRLAAIPIRQSEQSGTRSHGRPAGPSKPPRAQTWAPRTDRSRNFTPATPKPRSRRSSTSKAPGEISRLPPSILSKPQEDPNDAASKQIESTPENTTRGGEVPKRPALMFDLPQAHKTVSEYRSPSFGQRWRNFMRNVSTLLPQPIDYSSEDESME